MSQMVNLPGSLPRLYQHESIRGGLRRVLLGCLERARKVMIAASGTEVERVHEARVALKRARAVLQLGESGGVVWSKPARERLVEVARELGVVRDATVVAGTARQLGSFATITDAPIGMNWTAWSRRVAAEHRRLGRCRWPVLTRNVCVGALADSARRLRRRERAAKRRCNAHRLHDWRKRVIVLREQLNVLRVLLTARQQRHAARLHRVARELGVVQDLALLLAAGKHRSAAINRKSPLMLKARAGQQQAIKRARRLARGHSAQLRKDFGVE